MQRSAVPYAGELVPIAVNGDIRPTGNPLIGMSALRSTALSPVTTSAWSTPVDMVAIWSRTELLTGTAALAALSGGTNEDAPSAPATIANRIAPLTQPDRAVAARGNLSAFSRVRAVMSSFLPGPIGRSLPGSVRPPPHDRCRVR